PQPFEHKIQAEWIQRSGSPIMPRLPSTRESMIHSPLSQWAGGGHAAQSNNTALVRTAGANRNKRSTKRLRCGSVSHGELHESSLAVLPYSPQTQPPKADCRCHQGTVPYQDARTLM